jgi:predicted CoA-substrate-specific enzyme activase
MSNVNYKRSFLGIDVGSTTADAVLTDCRGEILRSLVIPTGPSMAAAAERCRQEILSGIPSMGEDFPITAATGYGRKRAGFARHCVTEITAHALGARHLFPGAATVIDMGGQDTKVIRLSPGGRVEDFAMNDKCAAGTGRFLEVMAGILGLDLDEMARRGGQAARAAEITSTCTVFVESEIISLIADNVPVDEIAAGVFKSIAGRILSMVTGIRGGPPYVLTGGVARNAGVATHLGQALKGGIMVPENPSITGALGAALFAAKNRDKDEGED